MAAKLPQRLQHFGSVRHGPEWTGARIRYLDTNGAEGVHQAGVLEGHFDRSFFPGIALIYDLPTTLNPMMSFLWVVAVTGLIIVCVYQLPQSPVQYANTACVYLCL